MGNAQDKALSQGKEILHIQHDPNNNGIFACRFTKMHLIHSNKMLEPRQCNICHRRMCQCAYIYQQTLKETVYECSQCVNEGHRKILRNIVKNELNHSMEVIEIIIDFAVGLIVNCCNMECDEEITFENKFLFLKQIDIDNNNIYHYEVSEIAELKTVYIGCIDKEIRIFCKSCSKETKNCQRVGCKNKDIYFDNDKNICSDHPSCICCGGISKYELSKCTHCHQSLCDNHKCSILDTGSLSVRSISNDTKEKCRFCYERDEKKLLTDAVQGALQNVLDINSINIIINFGFGCIVKCCKHECNQEIVFQNKMDFINKIDDTNNCIYYYKTNKINKLKSVQTPYIDEEIRIFCQLCSKKTVRCKYPYCENEDVYFEWKGICSNHYCPECVCCGDKVKYSTYLAQCINCNQYVCLKIKCGLKIKYGVTLCRFCLEKEKKTLMIDALIAVIGDILYEMIIKNICDFAFELVMDCCNSDCHQQIHFLSYSAHSRWYWYNINEVKTLNKVIKLDENPENLKLNVQKTDIVHNIRGEYLRIFCSNCTANKIYECEAVHCDNKDVNNVCFSHSYYCTQCKQRQKYQVRKCEYCMEEYCIGCNIHQKCWQRQQLRKLNKIQLKNVCKLNNLSIEGNKITLIDTILDYLNDKVADDDDIQIEIERECLRKLNKKQLKTICKSKGLPTNGNKQDLIEIILFHNKIVDKMKHGLHI